MVDSSILLALARMFGVLGLVGIAAYSANVLIRRFLPEKKQRRARGSPTEALETAGESLDGFFLKKKLLTRSELRFLGALQRAMPGDRDLQVMVQVSLGQVFDVDKRHPNRQGQRNRIERKSFDFLIVDRDSRPLMAIELDDESHKRKRRQARDRFVDSLCHETALPLRRAPVAPAYSVRELADWISALK